MKKKLISVILAGTMIMGTLAGCGGNKAAETGNKTEGKTGETQETSGAEEVEMADASEVDGTEISFWHSMGGVNGQAIDTLVKKFNDENEYGITVKAQYQGEYDDSLNKLKSSQIGNMGADLVQVYEIGTRFMIESGWITPMQQMIDADNYDLSQIEPNLAAYYTIDNQLYSMPFNSSTPIMYYNKEMFEKAGITEIPDSLEGIEAVGEKLLNEGGAGQVISLGIYGWFFELYDKGYAPNVGKGGDAGLADFSAGKSAITLGSTASLKQILQDVNGKFEVGTAYFPKVKSTDEGGVSIGGASLWALNNNDAKKTRATWEFVKFLISPESQAYWNAQTGYFPVTTAAQEEPVFKENVEKYPQFQTAIDQLHDSSPKYVGALLSVFPEARATVESEIENLLNGNADVKTAVKNMADAINKSIEEYNLVNQ